MRLGGKHKILPVFQLAWVLGNPCGAEGETRDTLVKACKLSKSPGLKELNFEGSFLNVRGGVDGLVAWK